MDNKIIEKRKKIGLLGCMMTAIGSTIGSGIFGTLPTAINSVGAGVITAFVCAAVYVIAIMIPNVYATSVIPTSGSFLLYPMKLIHPYLGLFMVMQGLLQPVLIASFSVLFAGYLVVLFPSMEGMQLVISLLLLTINFLAANRGNAAVVSFNSVMVALLLLAIFLFVFAGLPAVDVRRIGMGGVLHPNTDVMTIAAVIGILSPSLTGAGTVSQIANDVKNARRNIPLTLILAPLVVCLLYVLMSVVVLGTMTQDSIASLADVASLFLPAGLLSLFIVGGPLCGSVTPIVPVIMLSGAQIQAAVDCGIFPAIIGKKNNHGASPVILAFITLFSMAIVAAGADFSVLIAVFSVISAITSLPITLTPFFLYKKYPHACAHAGLKLNRKMVLTVSVFSFLMSVYLAYAMLITLSTMVVLLLIGSVALFSMYVYIRIRYLKKHGIDLMKKLGEEYEPWRDRERQCAQGNDSVG